MGLLLEIVTPESKAYSEEIDSATLPSAQGEIGILPGHIPLLTMLHAGEVMVERSGNAPEFLAIDKGFAQVFGDKISVLTESAITIDNINLDEVNEAEKRAKQALKEAEDANVDPAEIERLEAIARFAMAQQLVKKRRG